MQKTAILESIKDGQGVEEAAVTFQGLPSEEKVRLLEALRRVKTESAGRFLGLIYPDLKEKNLRKLVKTLLFHLKTSGVHVEEPQETAGEPALKRLDMVREAQGYMSNYDVEGTRVILTAIELRKKQYVFTHAITHFSQGLLDLASVPAPQKELDSMLKDYLWRMQPPIVLPPIAPAYAGYLLEEASSISGKETEEAKGIRKLATATRSTVQKPSDIYTLPVPDTTVPLPPDRILSHDIFDPFVLSWKGVEEDGKELAGVVTPSIVLPPYMIEERRQAFVKKLVESEKLRGTVSPMKRMLEDYAYLFHSLKDFDLYAGLVALLKEPAGVRSALSFFAVRSLDRLQKKEEQQPGVIVNPYAPKKK